MTRVAHDGQHRQREVHRTPEHRVDRVVEVPQGHGVDVPHLDDAGDVDRDVEPAVRLDDLGDEGLDRGGVAHVTDVGHEPRVPSIG